MGQFHLSGVRLRVPDRSQVEMVVHSPDDWVDADHPVRVIWRVVCTLELDAFHQASRLAPAESDVMRPICGC